MHSRPWRPTLGNTRRACCWRACEQRSMNAMRRWPTSAQPSSLPGPRWRPPAPGRSLLPVHQALHNLEQLIYLEQVDNLAPGTLLPVAAGVREMAGRKLNQMLDGAGSEIPAIPMGGQYGRMLADPPLVMHDEPPPALCLNRRDDWRDVVQAFEGGGKGIACVDNLLSPAALAQLQRFCLELTVWRRSYPPRAISAPILNWASSARCCCSSLPS